MIFSVFSACVGGTPYRPETEDGPYYPCQSTPDLYAEDGLPAWRPLILAHRSESLVMTQHLSFTTYIILFRGASGMYPEHTALAYRRAAIQGADVIECDLAITKVTDQISSTFSSAVTLTHERNEVEESFPQDFKFICSHEPWLSETTDIAERFPDRKMTYNMDDDDENFDWNDKGDITDEWFSFDFTLDELKTLKKIQPNEFRDPKYDGKERVVTLEELVDITRYKQFSSSKKKSFFLSGNIVKNKRGQSEFTQS